MIDDCTAVIMAGGDSRRMGRYKASLPLGEQSLIEQLPVGRTMTAVAALTPGVAGTGRIATIRRALVMGADPVFPEPRPGDPPVGVGEGTVIENAIVDKNARIGRGCRLVNERGAREDEGPGWAIRDGIVVVAKNAVIPDGTVL